MKLNFNFETKRCIQSINGVEYFGHTLKASRAELIEILGEPHSENGDKENYCWFLENQFGGVGCVHDRYPHGTRNLSLDEDEIWRVSAHTEQSSIAIKQELQNELQAKRLIII